MEGFHPRENLGVTLALKMPEWDIAPSLAEGLRDAFFPVSLKNLKVQDQAGISLPKAIKHHLVKK